MTVEYIPLYSKEMYPLVFFMYIAGGFGSNIDKQVNEIYTLMSVEGCAIQVDYVIDIAQNYVSKGYTHNDLKRIFTVNRQVQLADL